MRINGQALKQYRESKGYSQRELADATGIALSTLNKRETLLTANPFPSKLKIVTEKLGITIDDIALANDVEKDNVKNDNIKNCQQLSIQLKTPRDFLKCVRRELRTENAFTQYGMLGFLQYKLSGKTVDPDSMYYFSQGKGYYEQKTPTALIFEKIYGNIEASSDTIFNCWSFFRMFYEARTQKGYMYLDDEHNPIFGNIGENKLRGGLDVLFQGYEDILDLLNEFADLHHSLANMIPAPKGFNGYSYTNKYSGETVNFDGKGNYYRDNDIPDIYFKRAKTDFPKIYQWIIANKEKYCLDFFEEYISPWVDEGANRALNLNDKNAVFNYKKAISDAIGCIYKRSVQLYNLMLSQQENKCN